MHAVAIHNTSPVDGSRARALGAVLGQTAYDVRSRVLSAGPCVVSTCKTLTDAEALAARLEAAGFSTIVHAGQLDNASNWIAARSFALDPAGLKVIPTSAPSYRVPWDAVRLIVRGTCATSETTVETVVRKQFSMGRAIATSGFVRHKKVKSTQYGSQESREGFLHLHAEGLPVTILGEATLHYDGLEDRRQSARASNFLTLLTLVREGATEAGYDERLLTLAAQKAVLGRLEPTPSLWLASSLIAAARGLTLSAP